MSAIKWKKFETHIGTLYYASAHRNGLLRDLSYAGNGIIWAFSGSVPHWSALIVPSAQ